MWGNAEFQSDRFGRKRDNSEHFCGNGTRPFRMRGCRKRSGGLKVIERSSQLDGMFGGNAQMGVGVCGILKMSRISEKKAR